MLLLPSEHTAEKRAHCARAATRGFTAVGSVAGKLRDRV